MSHPLRIKKEVKDKVIALFMAGGDNSDIAIGKIVGLPWHTVAHITERHCNMLAETMRLKYIKRNGSD